MPPCLKIILSRWKMINFRLRILFVCLLCLCMIGAIWQNNRKQAAKDWRFCFMDPMLQSNSLELNESSYSKRSYSKRLEDVLLADIKPTPGRSIFFHETSCSLKNNPKSKYLVKNSINLNARQACAIESAALHNPNFSVFVLFATPTYWDNESKPGLPLIDAITSYKNVHLRNLNLWTYAAGTPIYRWLRDGQLFYSDYVLSHVSDFLRYLTLWRWGGTYVDMDVVMLRSIEDLKPNYAGAESENFIAAGVINFEHNNFGHQLATDCLRDLEANFKGSDWGNNGPGVITRVLKQTCNTKDTRDMIQAERCQGFHVFKRNAFYEIRWVEWQKFFYEKHLQETLNRTSSSYVIHVWNKHSSRQQLAVGTKAAYGVLAAEHCPKVYAAAGLFF